MNVLVRVGYGRIVGVRADGRRLFVVVIVCHRAISRPARKRSGAAELGEDTPVLKVREAVLDGVGGRLGNFARGLPAGGCGQGCPGQLRHALGIPHFSADQRLFLAVNEAGCSGVVLGISGPPAGRILTGDSEGFWARTSPQRPASSPGMSAGSISRRRRGVQLPAQPLRFPLASAVRPSTRPTSPVRPPQAQSSCFTGSRTEAPRDQHRRHGSGSAIQAGRPPRVPATRVQVTRRSGAH